MKNVYISLVLVFIVAICSVNANDDDEFYMHERPVDMEDAKLFAKLTGPTLLEEYSQILEKKEKGEQTLKGCHKKCEETFEKGSSQCERCKSRTCVKLSGPFTVKECYKLCKVTKKSREPCTAMKKMKILACAWANYKEKQLKKDPEKEKPNTKKAIRLTKKYAAKYRTLRTAARKHTNWHRLIKPPPPPKCNKDFKQSLVGNLGKCLGYLRRMKRTLGQGGIHVTKKMLADRKKKRDELIKKIVAQKLKDKKAKEDERKKELEQKKKIAAEKRKAAWKAKREAWKKWKKDKKICSKFAGVFKGKRIPKRGTRFYKKQLGLNKERWEAYSMSFWVKSTAHRRANSWASLFHLGRTNHQRNPAVWLYPGSHRLHIRSGTQKSWNAGCDCHGRQHFAKFNKFTHVAFSHSNSGTICVYVNGNKCKCCSVGGGPARRGKRLWMNSPGFRFFFKWWQWKFYVSDPWHVAAHAELRGMKLFGTILNQADVKKIKKKGWWS